MGLNSHAAPRLSFSSHAYKIVIKTAENPSSSAPEKAGSSWCIYYLSIIITNVLTSIPPLNSIEVVS